MYYIFKSETRFNKVSSKSAAVSLARDNNWVVFRPIKGIPNPWFVHRVLDDGNYELDRDHEKKEYSPDEMRDFLHRFFR